MNLQEFESWLVDVRALCVAEGMNEEEARRTVHKTNRREAKAAYRAGVAADAWAAEVVSGRFRVPKGKGGARARAKASGALTVSKTKPKVSKGKRGK